MPEEKLLNRKEICAALLLSYDQLQYYIARGLPHIGKGTEMIFNLYECNRWFGGGWIQTEKVKDGVLDCSLRKRGRPQKQKILTT